MAHCHGLGHGNCVPRYVGGVPELRKLDFRGLKGQFNVKNANFRGLISKIGHYMTILTTRADVWLIFMWYAMGIVP